MKLKKVMAATLATMMCLSSFSMMNVWADKKEDSEPLVINYISARGETDAAGSGRYLQREDHDGRTSS